MNSTLGIERNIAIDQQDILHLAIKVRIAFLQVVADLVRLDVMLVENSPHGAFASLLQSGVSLGHSLLANVACQCRNRPEFGCQSVVLGLGTGHANHPGLCLIRNFGFVGAVIGILECGSHSGSQRFVDALVDHRATNAKLAHQVTDRRPICVAHQNSCALDFTYRSSSRSCKLREHRPLFTRQHQCRSLRLSGHPSSTLYAAKSSSFPMKTMA